MTDLLRRNRGRGKLWREMRPWSLEMRSELHISKDPARCADCWTEHVRLILRILTSWHSSIPPRVWQIIALSTRIHSQFLCLSWKTYWYLSEMLSDTAVLFTPTMRTFGRQRKWTMTVSHLHRLSLLFFFSFILQGNSSPADFTILSHIFYDTWKIMHDKLNYNWLR